MPRFHVPEGLARHARLALPAGAARHAQVLRLQPGDAVTLFDGRGGEWRAAITRMGRSSVEVLIGEHLPVEREAPRAVHLAVGLMAAERMDWLVEKATELGAASITPLLMARSSLRLAGERAARKTAHWQAVAAAACEQSGRNRVPELRAPCPLPDWLALRHDAARCLLSLDATAHGLRQQMDNLPAGAAVALLSGPEGGLTADEETTACAAGFAPCSLGPRILRAETAPLAALALLTH